MGARAATVASHVVTVGPDGELIAAAAVRGGVRARNVWCVPSAEDALHRMRRILASGTDASAVLVKGARFTHMERISMDLRGRDIGCGLGCGLENCRLYINCSSCPQLELGSDRLDGC